jgi:hypothetical protein
MCSSPLKGTNPLHLLKDMPVSRTTLKQLFFSCFSVWYFLTISVWQLPDCPFKDAYLNPIRGFVYFWRLDQSWRLFTAPMYRQNQHSIALASYHDGIWLALEPTYSGSADSWLRFSQQRQILFYNYWLAEPGWKDWRAGAMRALVNPYSCPQNKIDSVSFNQLFAEIPTQGTTQFTREMPPAQTQFKHLFDVDLSTGGMP